MSSGALPDVTADDYQAYSEWLFMNTMVDLEMRLERPEMVGHRYLALGIAPLLRKLLVDGHPLAERVNRHHRLSLEFHIDPFAMSDVDCYEYMKDHFGGTLEPFGNLKYWRVFIPGALMPREENAGRRLGLAHFRQVAVGAVNGTRVKVSDIIKFYSNVEGGVHAGDARSPLEIDLFRTVPSELLKPMHGVGESPISALYVIGAITKKALLPLMKAVQANPMNPVPMPEYRSMPTSDPPGSKWWGGPELNRES